MRLLEACLDNLREQQRKALIPFITAGDPDPNMTVPLMHALVGGGADIIELGIPFSDPMADGPVIQRASERALAMGTSLHHVLDMVKMFRQTNQKTPVVLMGYLNPIEIMGYAAFAKAAQSVGVDGVLTVDMPPEEAEELVNQLRAHALSPIFLLAPTSSEERIRKTCAKSSGYIYYVSLKGVTGSASIDIDSLASKVANIRRYTHLPIGVGFGIRDAETARACASVSDAVIIGSALVQRIESIPHDKLLAELPDFMKTLRDAIDMVH